MHCVISSSIHCRTIPMYILYLLCCIFPLIISEPKPPTLLPLTADESSITANWIAPTVPFETYEITLYKGDCSIIVAETETLAGNETEKTYTNLHSGTTYCVRIQCAVWTEFKSGYAERKTTTSKLLCYYLIS